MLIVISLITKLTECQVMYFKSILLSYGMFYTTCKQYFSYMATLKFIGALNWSSCRTVALMSYGSSARNWSTLEKQPPCYK